LPECIIWNDYCDKQEQTPPITELFFASEWSVKEGPTRLPRRATMEGTIQKLLKMFTGKPKNIWVLIGLAYSCSDQSASDEEAQSTKKEASVRKPMKRKRAITIKTEVTAPAIMVSTLAQNQRAIKLISYR
jgi:hypothetical protein